MKSCITSYLHHIATSDIVVLTDGEPGLRPGEQDKGVYHFTRSIKQKEVHSLSIAQTLTLTLALSPNPFDHEQLPHCKQRNGKLGGTWVRGWVGPGYEAGRGLGTRLGGTWVRGWVGPGYEAKH